MNLARAHCWLILDFWVFSMVVQLAFMHASPYWPQDTLAWLIITFWPLVFLAIWVGAEVLAKRKAKEGDEVRFKFILKASLLAVPVVIFSAVIIVKLEDVLKPHFTP